MDCCLTPGFDSDVERQEDQVMCRPRPGCSSWDACISEGHVSNISVFPCFNRVTGSMILMT